jgi:hypothetical protein
MSYFASWQGKTHTGIDLIAAARSLISETEDTLLEVCVAQWATIAYAIDGQYTACMAELERAQNGLAASVQQLSAESPVYFYNEGFLASKTLHLGNAHLQSGEIDEAARVVGDAAGLAAQTRSARLVKELRSTRARMQPWQGTQAVSVLDRQDLNG